MTALPKEGGASIERGEVMTSTSVLTARVARETPSSLFIVVLMAALALTVALAVAYRVDGNSAGDDSVVVVQGP
jgi:hypothetical protein